MVAFTRGLPEPGSVGYSFFFFFLALSLAILVEVLLSFMCPKNVVVLQYYAGVCFPLDKAAFTLFCCLSLGTTPLNSCCILYMYASNIS